MADWIEEFEESLPHIRITVPGDDEHVFPVALLEDWIEGRKEISPECLPIVRAIMKEWLENLPKDDLWENGWERG